MISVDDIVTTQGKHPERARLASSDVYVNAKELSIALTKLERSFIIRSFNLTSGFRDPASNKAAGGSATSHHLYGRAADVADEDGELALWSSLNQDLLVHFGLYMENPLWTRERKIGKDGWPVRWCHYQIRPPPSGSRIFQPVGPQPK